MSLTGNTEVKNNLVGDIHIIKTINGYSAYEIAVQNGFEGTVEEWLKSIKGEKGEPGTMELFGELDAKGKRIMNVADPEEGGDAVNRRYFESVANAWMSENKLPNFLKEMSDETPLQVKNGGTGGKTAEEARKNIGAAPAEATSLYNTDTDIDVLTEPGFYYGRNIINSPFTNLYLEVGKGAIQYLGGPSGSELCTKNYYYQRSINLENGEKAFRCREGHPGRFTGVEWEYENPNPVWLPGSGRGEVIKTTERFHGNPVYTSVIFIYSFENGKEVDISSLMGESGTYGGTVIRYDGFLYKSGSKYRRTLPYFQPVNTNSNDWDSLTISSAWLTFYNAPFEGTSRMWMQMHGHNAAFDTEGYHQPTSGYVQIWFVKE